MIVAVPGAVVLVIVLVILGAVTNLTEQRWYKVLMASLKWLVLAIVLFAIGTVLWANFIAD